MKLFNKEHLVQATENSNQKYKFWLTKYAWHFLLSFSEGIKLLLLAMGSFIHAVFPWVLDFQLLKWRISMLKNLKKKLPNDPNLQKIKFLD
jgi:hypothetical protein